MEVLVRSAATVALVVVVVGLGLRFGRRTDEGAASRRGPGGSRGDPARAPACTGAYLAGEHGSDDEMAALLTTPAARVRTHCPVIESMELSDRYRYCPGGQARLGHDDGPDRSDGHDDRRDGPQPRRFGW